VAAFSLVVSIVGTGSSIYYANKSAHQAQLTAERTLIPRFPESGHAYIEEPTDDSREALAEVDALANFLRETDGRRQIELNVTFEYSEWVDATEEDVLSEYFQGPHATVYTAYPDMDPTVICDPPPCTENGIVPSGDVSYTYINGVPYREGTAVAIRTNQLYESTVDVDEDRGTVELSGYFYNEGEPSVPEVHAENQIPEVGLDLFYLEPVPSGS
jgi:hypothetical protein